MSISDVCRCCGQPGFWTVWPTRSLASRRLLQQHDAVELFGEAEGDEMVRAGANSLLVTHFQDQPRLARDAAERAEDFGPADHALTRVPVPVGMAVGVLQMHMVQHVAGGMDIIVDWRRTGGAVGVIG